MLCDLLLQQKKLNQNDISTQSYGLSSQLFQPGLLSVTQKDQSCYLNI